MEASQSNLGSPSSGGGAPATPAAAANSAPSLPSISVPKGGGAIRGIGEKFNTNLVSGTGSVSVPVTTSPGRGNPGPQLSLSYDSGGGNGPFGLGWGLSLPSITRKTDKGLPRYQDAEESDVFVLTGAEDLVPVLEGSGNRWTDTASASGYTIHRYRPRVEGLFSRLERWTRDDGDVHWRSITADNVLTLFGKDENSRIFDPENSQRIFTWLISETRDDKGEASVYEYKSEDGSNVDLVQAHELNRGGLEDDRRKANRYPKRIFYGNKTPLVNSAGQRPLWLSKAELENVGWMFELVFDYGEHDLLSPLPRDTGTWSCRQDPFSSHRAGFEVRTYRLCERVLMFHHFPGERDVGDNCLVRSTDLTYQRNPVATFVKSIGHSSYKRTGTGAYHQKSLPPVEFEYSQAVVQNEWKTLDLDSLENLPIGIDEQTYRWIDLDGEGLSGVLAEQDGAWSYKRNLSSNNQVKEEEGQKYLAAKLGHAEILPDKPSASLNDARVQFMDLAGDGQLDLVQMGGPVRGFYERSADSGWDSLRDFKSWPSILGAGSVNYNLVDLTGDGHADVLVMEDHVLSWYASLAEDGFGSPEVLSVPWDEEAGPRLVFDDVNQTIFLSDMSGDGLIDLVRIRNGDVCYWPSLGYGRFGPKVSMDEAPWFDSLYEFDPKRVLLVDIDGSGTTDIIYNRASQVDIYLNQAGNSWSESHPLTVTLPSSDHLSSVRALDLLGNGTACLVWSSPLPSHAHAPIQYVDLMGGQKPHLMTKIINNLGAETRLLYAPSTKFYLDDKDAGHSWITKIPFVVHVVEQVETIDLISRNRFKTRYKYHHGYFDSVDREFRGFGMVEQISSELYDAVGGGYDDGISLPATNISDASDVPPLLSRTWFHNGAFLDQDRISSQYEHEYYREGLTEDQARAMLLDDTVLPLNLQQPNGTFRPYTLTAEEIREACRALKGSTLRQEVYALDGTAKEPLPYSITEQNFDIKLLQPLNNNRHAVFLAHPREQIDVQYERKQIDVNGKSIADPRITHSMTLDVDPFGNVLRSVAINYRRRALGRPLESEQEQTHMVLSVNRFASLADDPTLYREGLAVESRVYEVVKPPEPSITDGRIDPFNYDIITILFDTLFPRNQDNPQDDMIWPYESWDWRRKPSNAPPNTRLRLTEQSRMLYIKNDLSGPCAFGEVESLALPYEGYKLALTQELARTAFVESGRTTSEDLNNILGNEAKYVHVQGDEGWWIPSGRVFFSPTSTDSPHQELEFARQHFFRPRRSRDPFHLANRSTETIIIYDSYDLLVTETHDALGNHITIGERDSTGTINPDIPGNDYRVQQPRLVTDANGNRTEVMFDTLGLVVATAIKGKVGESLGDSLDAVVSDLTDTQLDEFHDASDPHQLAISLLGGASARTIHDIDRFKRSREAHPQDPSQWQPGYMAMLASETHNSDPIPPDGRKVQIDFGYSDGFGRQIQNKVQAEPGPLVEGGPSVSRWVGNGWTIFNNRGKPVRKYEPFFSAHHRFEFAVQKGVSPILFYDPMDRVVGTLSSSHTYSKVVFDAWTQATFDANDTVLSADPKSDPDIGDFFRRLPDSDYLPTWYTQRKDGALGVQERDAARKAAVHADTPTLVHADSLGRTFLTISHEKSKYSDTPADSPPIEAFHNSRIVSDIEGNQREVIDAKGRVVMRLDHDVLGNVIHQSSMEAGERWTLNTVMGKALYSWNSRGHRFRTMHDQLQRPSEVYCRDSGGREILTERNVFGDTLPNPELKNLRGKMVQIYDQAGILTSNEFDFKGNSLSSQRQFAQEYKTTLDWSTDVSLETTAHISRVSYDALNRPKSSILADGTIIRTAYSQARLPERIEATLRDTEDAISFITNIDYDAKGQRQLIQYGNGVTTAYEYDPLTFRMRRLLTRRDASGDVLQDLKYTYDSSGNLMHIRDDAQQTIFFRNKRVEPSSEYTYSSAYQLIEANGREHLGQSSGTPGQPTPPSASTGLSSPVDHPNDGNAMGRYLERYLYDAVGNIEAVKHIGTDPAQSGWTRNYTYREPSQTEQGKTNNRLSTTSVGSAIENYSYTGDAGLHGNITSMPHLPFMQWNYKDQLHATAQQVVTNGGSPETTWYVYDASGQRVRKITERQSAAGEATIRLKERIYLGSFEFYRKYGGDGVTIDKDCETVHIMDGDHRAALVEIRNQGLPPGVPKQLVRYQFSNHLGSASLELDDRARILSYEEYFPYGSTSYHASDSQVSVPKRYRYTGKELDEESGLSFHGARYYAPWIGRWTAPDPIGIGDGLNIYAYVANNPINYHDPGGTEGKSTGPAKPAKPKTPNVGPNLTKLNLEAKPLEKQNIRWGGQKVEAYVIPGTSKEKMLILGGVHQQERAGIRMTKALLDKMIKDAKNPTAKKPYYTVIFVPDLFGGRRDAQDPGLRGYGTPPGKDELDANRNLTPKKLAESLDKNGVPVDSEGRPMYAENVILTKLYETYKFSRSLSIHDHSKRDTFPISQGDAGASIDPRGGKSPDGEFVTREMVYQAHKAGLNVRGSIITPEMAKIEKEATEKLQAAGGKQPTVVTEDMLKETTLRILYPNETADSQKGTTFGNAGSHVGNMDQFLIEVQRGGTPADVNPWHAIIERTLLQPPSVVRQNSTRPRDWVKNIK